MVDLPPLHDDLTFLSPLGDARADVLVGFAVGGAPERVLDIGCGWGELLLRTVAAPAGVAGLGIDFEPERIEEARRRAEVRGLGERVTFEARDGRTITGSFDTVLCLGASHIWGPPVEAGQPLAYSAALTALRDLLRPGGRLVYGEAVWCAAPTPAATAALSGRADEFLGVDEVADAARAHGFEVVGVEEATLAEWDAFEDGFVRRLERWLAAHPADHPDAPGVREQLREQRERYLRGYRGVLGMAYLRLVAR